MRLLEPVSVGAAVLKNRVMFPPMTTGYEGRGGEMTPKSTAFYERLARGGTGYIVIGDVNPVPGFSPTPRLYEDAQIPSFRDLTDAVHRHDAKIAAQIFYPEYDVSALMRLAAQGDMAEVRARLHHDMDHFTNEVSEEQLMQILAHMVQCAVRVAEAGFDAVQIHGDRLLGTLCGTKLNQRRDRFGGTLENRARFARMVTRAIRAAVPDLMLDYKLSVITPERGKGGVDRDDAVQFAVWLQEDGVDMLHVAQGNHTGNLADTIPPMGVQPYAFFAGITADVKRAVAVPVSVVGRIVDPTMAENLLVSGVADIAAVGRALLADPDWVVKLTDARSGAIRRCISCNKGCVDTIQNRQPIGCVLNAETGFELERAIVPAQIKKRVAVVGGGAAGLEAARVLAVRGHEVTLYERERALGGQLHLAAAAPRKHEIDRALQDLTYAALSAGATIKQGAAVTQQQLLASAPDAVVVAVGASPTAPRIPGHDGPNVLDAWKVIAGEEQAYGQVVVIGGGLVGCETAELLATQGCQVTIVEMLGAIATGESITVLPTLMAEFAKFGVTQHLQTTVTRILPDGVECRAADGEAFALACDCVVIAVGARPGSFETSELTASGIKVHRIGDCMTSGTGTGMDIWNAVHSGYVAACAI